MRNLKTAVSSATGLAVSLVALQAFGSPPQEQPVTEASAQSATTATPFQNNNGVVATGYTGPLFKLNHSWPAKPLPPISNPPWRVAIGNGKINTKNAAAYADALKQAVAPNARKLIMDQQNWNAAEARWYNEPWLGSQREAISGTYAAGTFGPSIFPDTGLKATFNTHVLTYYDERAANALYNVWGTTAMKPVVTPTSGQFAEGSIVVKAAVFASADPKQQLGWWDAMNGAQVWNMYLSPDGKASPQVWPGYVAQFDIIVKDSRSAPQTGWVYMTLVYDKDAPGQNVWDKMVPLGAQWGNDPQATKAGMPLRENWINPKAPKYSTQTLGWGGRLSGPNDGATNDIVFNGKAYSNYADSSCMSCHSTAQWNTKTQSMPTFLLPTTSTDAKGNPASCDQEGKPAPKGSYICSPAPGSAAWMKWFQNRPGNKPMDAGAVAMDFDEVFSFKSLRLWRMATTADVQAAQPTLVRIPGTRRFNLYNGAPLKEE